MRERINPFVASMSAVMTELTDHVPFSEAGDCQYSVLVRKISTDVYVLGISRSRLENVLVDSKQGFKVPGRKSSDLNAERYYSGLRFL